MNYLLINNTTTLKNERKSGTFSILGYAVSVLINHLKW